MVGPPELLLTDSAKKFRPGPSCVDDWRVWLIGGPALKHWIIIPQNETSAWLGCSFTQCTCTVLYIECDCGVVLWSARLGQLNLNGVRVQSSYVVWIKQLLAWSFRQSPNFFEICVETDRPTNRPTNHPTYLSLDASLPKHNNWITKKKLNT